MYRIYSKFWDKQASANTVDPDQTPQNAVFDQDLHCLLFTDKKKNRRAHDNASPAGTQRSNNVDLTLIQRQDVL